MFLCKLYAINELLHKIKDEIVYKDKNVKGFNIGINNSKSSGQTINHCHIHLIPRRDGDVFEPTGGVRFVIPKKANYKK